MPVPENEFPLLSTVIRSRIRSNLAFSEWVKVFADEKLTTALLDRLTHHAHILATRGDSYRANKRKADADNRSPPSTNNKQ